MLRKEKWENVFKHSVPKIIITKNVPLSLSVSQSACWQWHLGVVSHSAQHTWNHLCLRYSQPLVQGLPWTQTSTLHSVWCFWKATAHGGKENSWYTPWKTSFLHRHHHTFTLLTVYSFRLREANVRVGLGLVRKKEQWNIGLWGVECSPPQRERRWDQKGEAFCGQLLALHSAWPP